MAFNPNYLQLWSAGNNIPGLPQLPNSPQSFGYYAGNDTIAEVLAVNYFRVFAFNSGSALYEFQLGVNDLIYCVCSDGNFSVTVTSIRPNVTTVLTNSNFNVELSVYAATTGSNLTTSYYNGVNGVGAQLTNTGAFTTFTLDGTTPPLNSRILVKDQTLTYENGIYTVTNVGSGTAAWVLTRAVDYDVAPSQIFPGNLVIVDYGIVNSASTWIQTASVTTIGTDAIIFSAFAQFAGIRWNVVTSTTNMVANNGYIPNSSSLIHLDMPPVFNEGVTFGVAGFGSGGWQVNLGTGQRIHFGNVVTSSGGLLASTNSGDGFTMVAVVANTDLVVIPGSQGNITFA
jgi:hypothetical protein